MAPKEDENVPVVDVSPGGKNATISWHALSIEETVKELGCNADLTSTGLSTAEAKERYDKYGPNKMTEKEKKTIWQRIWAQVANVLVGILVTVAAVSFGRAIQSHIAYKNAKDGSEEKTTEQENIISNWIQVALITGVITTNTYIGILQEGSAEKAAEALKSMLSSDARVIRDGKESMIPGTDVVPGDLVILSLGDRIPADLRMSQVRNMACEEAALTGESVPIDKTSDAIVVEGNPEQTPLGDRHNMAFSATLVAQGSGVGICVTSGDYTQIGTINKLVSQVEEKKTAVLEQIDQVSKWLAFFICLAAIITFFIARFRADMGWLDCVTTALVCAVAMIPEGLEAIVTLTYAWAVSNMAKKNAIIRALPAVETLGSVTIICSDKTGTLTQNIMSLTTFVTSNARYKVDVNSTDRQPTSFVRDDGYMAERAQHQLKRSVSTVIRDGPNSNQPRKGHLSSSNHFAVTDLHTPASSEHQPAEAEESESSEGPFAAGESPTLDYVRSVLAGGVLCSNCVLGKDGTREGAIGNPTELSILRAAYFAGVDIDALKKGAPAVNEVPFSSEYKFMATVHEPVAEVDGDVPADHYVVHVKGAPDRMLALCETQAKSGLLSEENLEPVNSRYWTEQIAILSSHGLRVLGLCRAVVPKSSVGEGDLGPEFVNGRGGPWLTMVGLCAIMDPPRPECVQAIKEAHGAGVRVCMITGDHKDTATAIGHMLGIVDETYSEALTGPELDEMSDDQLREAVMSHNVFARASPQNKIRIVKALQAEGQVSGMTGDGVNDAPALKAADMGVAMGKEGTDVAREAAEMILADDNFATIVTAVREGRVVWDNLRKVLLVNTPINNAQGLTVLLGLALGLKKTPLTAIQILYSNLICAVTLGFVCAIEPAEDGIMSVPPRMVGKRLIGRFLFLRIMIGTIALSACTVGSVFVVKSYMKDNEWKELKKVDGKVTDELVYTKKAWMKLRVMAFNALDFGAISVCLSARFSYLSSFHPRIFSGNAACWYSVAIVAVLQIALTYIPGINEYIFQQGHMDGYQWLIVIGVMTIVFSVMELEKALRRYLVARGVDTEDNDDVIEGETVLPKGAHITPEGAEQMNLVSLEK